MPLPAADGEPPEKTRQRLNILNIRGCPSLCASLIGMSQWSLVPHPDHPPQVVRAVRVEVIESGDDLLVTFIVEGAGGLLLPDRLAPRRTAGLWKRTCFEMFLRPEGQDAYFEFNFSPSSGWAAYRFDDHRTGMRDLVLAVAPHIDPPQHREPYQLEVDLELDATIPDGKLRMGLSAVIEETGGTKSYWALAHPSGPPDFHDPACFTATLSAPAAP